MADHGIKDYEISVSGLEEVFVRANNETSKEKPINQEEVVKSHTMDEAKTENLIGQGGFCGSLGALICKRLNIYKRDFGGLICEVFIPVLLVIIGLTMLQFGWLVDSPAFYLDTDAYPGPQRVLFNSANVEETTDQLTPEDIYTKLPDYDSYWKVTTTDQTDTWNDYYQEVGEQRFVGDELPYRFGSYEIYKADTSAQEYQVNVYVNATSDQAVPYFAQYMYEAILANVNDGIKFKTKTSPFPLFHCFAEQVEVGQSLDFNVVISFALALIPCCIVAYIIKERET